jgi:hypothetical protein
VTDELRIPRSPLTLEEIVKILEACTREELRDHTFGDVEVYWMKGGKEVAVGYFGSSSRHVGGIDAATGHWFFKDADADRLRRCGKLDRVDRNDETGPDHYQGY